MRYRYETIDDLMLLTLEGDVELVSWRSCFFEIERRFIQNHFDRLLIDGSRLKSFDLSDEDCRHLSPGFTAFARKTAFYSDTPLIFGMMRVVHSYAFNDGFKVFKTSEDASSFLANCDRMVQLV